ncbi:hypothetical protein [Lysinibacter sp. HNR]|uniref:PH-like domain-containing protein n=1 Tax=Lysinibacter sp. HNR TaxID=3031408 RepID=UPI00243537F5|nr:hypothetical protein [Lysinibacter sp. HNR]WGD36285.1 hypothetical protein FrondiHNR_07260 [Lysinibacter sp. HNR]
MENLIPTLIIIALLGALFALMWWAWSARKKRSSHLLQPLSELTVLGESLGQFDVLYVSTTPADQPLERIALPGLTFRGHGVVEVTTTGIMLDIAGERSTAIEKQDIRGADTAQTTIDKAVERDGLIVVQWNLRTTSGDSSPVDSYFRITHPEEKLRFMSLVSELAYPQQPSTTTIKET